ARRLDCDTRRRCRVESLPRSADGYRFDRGAGIRALLQIDRASRSAARGCGREQGDRRGRDRDVRARVHVRARALAALVLRSGAMTRARVLLVAIALALLAAPSALAKGEFDPSEEFVQHEWVSIHLGPLNLSITKAVVYLLLGAAVTIFLGLFLMRGKTLNRR